MKDSTLRFLSIAIFVLALALFVVSWSPRAETQNEGLMPDGVADRGQGAWFYPQLEEGATHSDGFYSFAQDYRP
ncbi:MAG TPA: hypothetical protein VGC53_00240 [Vicinamibacteria bacterium]|jgi:hypothetical protein